MLNIYFDFSDPHRPYTYCTPATPGTFPPDNALRGESEPAITPGYWPCEKDGKIIDVEDHRGRSGYVFGHVHVVDGLGPLPEGWSDTPPGPIDLSKEIAIIWTQTDNSELVSRGDKNMTAQELAYAVIAHGFVPKETPWREVDADYVLRKASIGRTMEIKQLLASIDMQKVRPLSAIVDNTATDEDRAVLEELNARSIALRDEMQLLKEVIE